MDNEFHGIIRTNRMRYCLELFMSLIDHNKKPVSWEKFLKSGDRIYIGSNASVPNAVVEDLLENVDNFHDIEVTQLLTLSENRWAEPEYRDHFKVNALFIGGKNIREAVTDGRADYTPCFLSEVPSLFKRKILPIDVALVTVSPPDEYGYCSLGISVDVGMAAVKNANYVVAQINSNMPRTTGNSFVHINDIDAYIERDDELAVLAPPELDQITEQIGQYVSLLIEDGATLQLGIGKIPDAVLRYLNHHKDLGIHTEMISDGIIDLMKSGVVNNSKKTYHPGKAVTSFCMGTRKLYDFVDGNPHIEFYPTEHVNNPLIIAQNEKMVSINSAIEIDLTGQVVSDSIGYNFFSGIGGQVDFIRGASLSSGGVPIIAMPSTTKDGKISKIVPHLTEGGGVVTSRGDVYYVVTEYGIASLRGKSVRERALELIRIAHPKFRDDLLAKVRKNYWVPEFQNTTPSEVPEFGSVQRKALVFHGSKNILRPLNPSDERRLQEFFYSHNRETLMMRYNHHVTSLSREKSCNLVSVDQAKDLALCFSEIDEMGETIQGVGRYYLNESDNSCETAFVVKESKRGHGMSKTLLKEMEAIARQRGLDRMTAVVRRDNSPMLKVFEQGGFSISAGEDIGELFLELKLK